MEISFQNPNTDNTKSRTYKPTQKDIKKYKKNHPYMHMYTYTYKQKQPRKEGITWASLVGAKGSHWLLASVSLIAAIENCNNNNKNQ